ncbi:CFEM-containing protein [Coleophoma crateriformis]|uniref:CFEM-containing protein n=1 Tax=Coleophoma crateriformis TaxID=565419 RepID=A0A3D8QU97_9HELO|nr:CFEM-containing protein [Coleophoma crateriformis]
MESSQSAYQTISQATNKAVLIACLAVSVFFVLLRIVARWYKLHRIPLEAEDLSLYFALVAFAAMCALCLLAMPPLYDALAVANGENAPDANLNSALVSMLKKFFAVQLFFWLTLWAVKASLLLMIKTLTTGLPLYTKLWWSVMVFVVLTYLACVLTQIESCANFKEWFTADACSTARDSRAKAISLWFALGVDLLTDLMIMAIPIRLLWGLQKSIPEKLSLGTVFSVGLITMVVAIIRAVSLKANASGGQISAEWLILWAGIEGVVAILVGCLPAFAVFLRKRVTAARGSKVLPQSPLNLPTHPQSDKPRVSGDRRADNPPTRNIDAGPVEMDGQARSLSDGAEN